MFVVTACLFTIGCFAGESGAKVLLPGFTFYQGKEELTGKLLFVAGRSLLRSANDSDAGIICTIDLKSGEFEKLADCPSVENFVSSANGDACAVLSLEKPLKRGEMMSAPLEYLPTTAFLHCPELRQSKSLRLATRPKDVAFVGRHFFFQVDVFDGEPSFGTVPSAERILHYDFDKDVEKYLELPNASRWERERFQSMSVEPSDSNALYFHYGHSGDRVREGRDYPSGSIYMYDVQNETAKAATVRYSDSEAYAFKCFDGQFVWFSGYDTPIIGYKLYKSKWKEERIQMLLDPKEANKKLLTKFSRFGGKVNKLLGISPCGHFAFIQCTTQRFGKPSANTYHIVDVTSGDSRILLRDEVQLRTDSSISSVWWVK